MRAVQHGGGYTSIALLAWALLVSSLPEHASHAAEALLPRALAGGALGALGSMMASTVFQKSPEEDHRLLCGMIAFQLLAALLQHDARSKCVHLQ